MRMFGMVKSLYEKLIGTGPSDKIECRLAYISAILDHHRAELG
jgi:hypothetical protein